MLNKKAFANALAATAITIYVGIFLLKLTTPPFFRLIVNSQFFGANVASQVPATNPATLIGILIAVGVVSWVTGYLLASFYNRFNRFPLRLPNQPFS